MASRNANVNELRRNHHKLGSLSQHLRFYKQPSGGVYGGTSTGTGYFELVEDDGIVNQQNQDAWALADETGKFILAVINKTKSGRTVLFDDERCVFLSFISKRQLISAFRNVKDAIQTSCKRPVAEVKIARCRNIATDVVSMQPLEKICKGNRDDYKHWLDVFLNSFA